MSDANVMARECAPAAGEASEMQRVSVKPGDVRIRFSLRIAPTLAAEVREAGGFDLTGEINSATSSGTRIAARIGPDEWLLIARDGELHQLTKGIEAALTGHFFSLVDVSDRNVAIEVAGQAASTVLSAGIPIDLDDSKFPPGSATRTVLGKAEIVLVRAGGDHIYRVECWRSFAPYVRQFIDDAAREFTTL